MKPEISVVMVARNAEATVDAAIRSVLRQSYGTFEFIVIDDGSDDGTFEVMRRFATDKRLVLLRSPHNYIAALNLGLQTARAPLIARMDADDYMHPARLMVQAGFMLSHPQTDICGTWMRTFGDVRAERRMPGGAVDRPWLRLLEGNFLFHPTVMLRKEFLDRHGLSYRQGYTYAEDYRLWAEAALSGARFHILPAFLHYYRKTGGQTSVLHAEQQYQTALKVRRELLHALCEKATEPRVNKLLQEAAALYEAGSITFPSLLRIVDALSDKIKI
ncbi:MAG: glycosyltransferase [Bacteroidaceae bacterium]|nr:glycosyltransferase [Bacteroidaceae bacterium]